MIKELIFLYGPPGSGKTSVGCQLAQSLDLSFIDLDAEIEKHSGQSVSRIFLSDGEDGFRQMETENLTRVCEKNDAVISLGGGTLLDGKNRDLVERHGRVLLLTASPGSLVERLAAQEQNRPLLQGDAHAHLNALLEQRVSHYRSFPVRLDTTHLTVEAAAQEAQTCLGRYHISNMGNYDVRIHPGGMDAIGELLEKHTPGRHLAVVSDEHVGKLYAKQVTVSLRKSGFQTHLIFIPSGEKHKTIRTVETLWEGFILSGLGRDDAILALGGGVVSDLAGYAAAAFLRGVNWVAMPTTLLAMADASLGGKTGVDLPQGKNLVGAFHPPRLVLTDPLALNSLPEIELRAGMAEIIKHGIIADPLLFSQCTNLAGTAWLEAPAQSLDAILRRAVAVKTRYIEADPFEQGVRAALNLGHTIGHALEAASGYQITHGEAVSIGMVVEAQLAEEIGLAEPGVSGTIIDALRSLGLPVGIPPEINRKALLQATHTDKKRQDGKVHFSLPVRIGKVITGIEIENLWRKHVLNSGTSWTQPEPAGQA